LDCTGQDRICGLVMLLLRVVYGVGLVSWILCIGPGVVHSQ
jgi:hypothetical protein